MNCILVVIDALDYTRVQKSRYELLPFLSSMGKKGIVAENMYSEAPYTEAAAMALYAGQHTLDNGGYLERYNRTKETIFETFKNAGYSVYFNALQPQCFPTSLRRGITDIYYDRGFDSDVLWRYRLEHYSKEYHNGTLDEADYEQIYRILDDNFEDWFQFLDDLISKDESVEIISELNKDYNPKEARDFVSKQKDNYLKNKKKYVENLLDKGCEHPLFSIPYFAQIDYAFSSEVKELLNGRCRKICKTIKRKNVISNIFSNKDVYYASWKAICNLVKYRDYPRFLNSMYLVKNAVSSVHIDDRYGEKSASLKGQPSFYTLNSHFLSWLDSRKGKKPFFACLHVDDIHFPEEFFSYDANDSKIISRDLDLAQKYLSGRTWKQAGTIIHDMSLLYADNQCRLLYEEIVKRNLQNETVFIITADHGFSYSGYPIREKAINTFYLENFKIPFYAFGPNITGQEYKGLESSVSIPASICEMMGIKKPSSFCKAICEQGEEYLFIEYCGGGCPDLRRREVMLAVFDGDFFVAAKAKLADELTENKIVEIYDLKKDPMQRKNMLGKIDRAQYSKYYEVLKKRFMQLQTSM